MAIRQTISLDGLQTVQTELKNLADVGESAFSRIRAAVEGGGGGLEAIATNILNIGKALTSLTGAVTVFAGITGGLVALTVSASNAGEEFENLGTQLGTTTDNASALISSFARAGADIQGLAGQLRRAAVNISNEFAQIQTSVREAGLKRIGDNIAVAQSFNNLAKANVAAAEQEHNAALQRQADSLAVADAQSTLNDLLEKQRIAQGGVRDPQLEAERAAAKEEQQIAKARLQLAQAEQKAKEDAALADQRATEVAIAAETAQLALAKARLQAAEDNKNSITNLVGFVTDLANGVTNTGRAVNATVDNLFKGIIASSAGLDASLGPIEGDISNIASPTVLSVLLKLSDVLKNMGSETEKTALASKFLGRTVGQEEVAFLSQGSKAIQEHIESVKALGLEFSTGMAAATQKFRISLFTLEDTLSRIKDQIGATFAPVFGPFFQVLADLLANNRQLFLNWAQTLAETVKPTLDSIIRVLSGKENAVDDKWLLDIIEKFKNFGATIRDIVVPAIKSILDVIGFVAKEINNLFGTNLDAASGIFILWVTNILGGFKLIGIGLNLLTAAFTAFAARAGIALAPVLLAIGAISVAFLAILALVDKATFEGLKKLGADLVELGQKMANNFGKPVEDTAQSAEQSFTTLIDKAADLGTAGKKAGTDTSQGLTQVKTSADAANQSIQQLVKSVETGATEMKGALNQIPVFKPEVFTGTGTPSFITGTGFAATRQTAEQFRPPTTQPQQQLDQQSQQQVQQQAEQKANAAVEAFQAASDKIIAIWNSLKDAIDAIDFSSIFEGLSEELTAPFLDAEEGIIAVFDAIAQEAERMAQRIVQAAQQAAQAIKQVSSGGGFGGQPEGAPFAAGGRVVGPGSWTSDSIPARLSRDEFVQPAFRVHQYGLDFMEAIRRGILSVDTVRALMGDFRGFSFEGKSTLINNILNKIANYSVSQSSNDTSVSNVRNKATDYFSNQIHDTINHIVNQITEKTFSNTRNTRNEFIQPVFRVQHYGMDIMEAIRRGLLSIDKLVRGLHLGSGGRVIGPGSWTSDSIPAWLSRDEFVQPAFRVQQYGVDFMEAIRRGLLSTDMVRTLMGDFRCFKFGGSISPFPKFAEGGSVGGSNTRILQLVLGGQTFTTTGPAKVIDALEREAALRGIASTGIAQSFVGRR